MAQQRVKPGAEADIAIGPRERKPRAVPSRAEAPSIEAAPEAKRRRKLNRLMQEVDRQKDAVTDENSIREKVPTFPIEGQRRGSDRFHHNLEIIEISTE